MKWMVMCIAVCGSVVASAQYKYDYLYEQKEFEGGFTLGVNATQVDGDGFKGYRKVGIQAGGRLYIHFGARIGLTMELLYAQKGCRGSVIRESGTAGAYTDNYYLDLNYVEMPVLLHFKTGLFLDWEGGYSFGRLVNAREWTKSDAPVSIDPVINSFDNTDFSWILGATMRLGRHTYANLRYQYSVDSIRPWERTPLCYCQFTGEYNNVVTFRVIYMF